MTSVYLAHSSCEMERGKKLQTLLENNGVEVWNPFDKLPEIREEWKALGEAKEFTWNRALNFMRNRKIVESDILGIDESDMIVLLFPDGATIGMPCELMYAYTQNKKVISIVPELYEGHPWILHLSSKTFKESKGHTDKDICDYIVQNYVHVIKGLDTKRHSTHKYMDEVTLRDLTYEVKDRGKNGHSFSLIGGSTGYESFYIEKKDGTWTLEKMAEKGWLACFGTDGSYHRLEIPSGEMAKVWEWEKWRFDND